MQDENCPLADYVQDIVEIPNVCTRHKARMMGLCPPTLKDLECDRNVMKNSCSDILGDEENDVCNQSSGKLSRASSAADEEVRLQMEKETWIQCDSVDCQKWRRVQTDEIKDIGDSKWFCFMNSDLAHRSCDSPEEDYAAYDKLASKIGIKYVYSELQEGSLVWAKIIGYCRWPALITKDPACDLLFATDRDGDPLWYHVEFLGEPHSHGWASSKNITVYGHKDSLDFRDNSSNLTTASTSSCQKNSKKWAKKRKALLTQMKKPELRCSYKRESVRVAIEEADKMLDWSEEDRLNCCVFNVTQTSHNSGMFSLEKQPEEENYDKPGTAKKRKLSKTPSTTQLKNKCRMFTTELQQNKTDTYPDGQPTTKCKDYWNFNSTLVDKTKEEKLTFDVEMYRRNEKAFEHDVRRFMDREGMRLNLLPVWQNTPIRLFQLFSVVLDQGGYQQVCSTRSWSRVYREVTEHSHSTAGSIAKAFYQRNLLPYELYLKGQDFKQAVPGKEKVRGKKHKEVTSQQKDEQTDEDCCSEISEDLEMLLASIEESSLLYDFDVFKQDLSVEEGLDPVFPPKPTRPKGLDILFHDESPDNLLLSPGVKLADTASEFGRPNLPGDSPPLFGNESDGETASQSISSSTANELLAGLDNVKQQIELLNYDLLTEE